MGEAKASPSFLRDDDLVLPRRGLYRVLNQDANLRALQFTLAGKVWHLWHVKETHPGRRMGF
jgi:hypothetical protein